uniref:DUF4503 domain-containing protein n=1 Tax=Mesocestoides corti TaxID=53468 RepID=A0A5K3EQ74_MESCO
AVVEFDCLSPVPLSPVVSICSSCESYFLDVSIRRLHKFDGCEVQGILHSKPQFTDLSCWFNATPFSQLPTIKSKQLPGFFVLDAFSRIELLDVDLLPVTSGKCIRHHSFPPAFDHSRPDGLLNLSLITTSGVVVGVDSSASQVWPLCPGCLSDELKHPLDKVAATALECSRCQAKIDKPFHAMEVVVELGVDEQTDSVCSIQSDAMQRRCVKVCMLPSQLAEMVCLSEAQLLQPSLVNPNCLIGRPVDFLLGTLIMLPSVRGSQDFAHQCQAVIVQLPSNLLTSLAHSVTSVPC